MVQRALRLATCAIIMISLAGCASGPNDNGAGGNGETHPQPTGTGGVSGNVGSALAITPILLDFGKVTVSNDPTLSSSEGWTHPLYITITGIGANGVQSCLLYTSPS